jgi:hypothetical protein
MPWIKMEEMLGPASIPFSSECNCILEKTVETTIDRFERALGKCI